MSIYPVPLQIWFPHPRKNQYGDYWERQCQYEAARISVKLEKCHNCGGFCKWNRAWGHHSIPWGYGEVWCSEKCLLGPKRKKKTARQKKQRNKRYKIWDKISKELYEK